MPTYYSIDETLARRAKEMNSFWNYEPGSATASYRQEVDKAAAIAEAQKARVDPMYHEKIDRLLDTYARKLAENLNHGCPAVPSSSAFWAALPAREARSSARR